MAELVSGIDCQPGENTRERGEQYECPPTQWLQRGVCRNHDNGEKMQRNNDVGKAPVVVVPVQLRDDFFGWVVPIFADRPIDDRRQSVVEDKRQDEPNSVAALRVKPEKHQGLQRMDYGQKPKPALPVNIMYRLSVCGNAVKSLHRGFFA